MTYATSVCAIAFTPSLPSRSNSSLIDLQPEASANRCLADRVRQCTSWEEIEAAIASDPIHKNEAWALLTMDEKELIKAFKIAAAQPIDPNCESLVGKRVFVTEGRYRASGEGIVECDRGYGTLRGLEVRFSNGRIQFCSLKDARVAFSN